MNLIREEWIKGIHLDQNISNISPFQITQNCRTNPIVDVVTNRPDFKGALYQLLIGLLQTAHPPMTEKEWFAQWESPPSPEELEDRFAKVESFFNLDTGGPAFMQDFDLPDGVPKPIDALLIDAPGGKTLRDNLDHFVKRRRIESICHCCAGLALFTLQTNAPSGGVGHRTGLRGGGPLTTLVMPDEIIGAESPAAISLWHKVWLNVLPEKTLRKLLGKYKWDTSETKEIFPWMGPTRTSEKRTGNDTFPSDVHPYQMYWGMPRRVRIDFADSKNGTCQLCGATDRPLVRHFSTKNYGINYSGPWEHPLTPYGHRQQTDMPLPLHGQKGGVTYRHWLGLTLGNRDNNQKPAQAVAHYLDRRAGRLGADRNARIWSFGYDMDNMKARCWYDALMPLFHVAPSFREAIKGLLTDFVEAAEEVVANLRQEVKKAWCKRPKDVKGDWAFIDIEFWQMTEGSFYSCIKSALRSLEQEESPKDVAKTWHIVLRKAAMQLFDRFALAGPAEDMELERIVTARNNLFLWLHTGKKVKQLLGKS